MNTNTVVRNVRDLQVGDRLASGLVILRRPVRGLRTPSGKHEVFAIRLATERKRWYVWGSNTKIAVTPAPDCFVLDEKALDNL